MRFTKLISLLIVFSVMTVSTALSKEVKILAFEYPPLLYSKKIGDLGYGYFRDIIDLSFKETGTTVKFVFKPMKRLKAEFDAKKFPIVIGHKLPPNLDKKEELVLGYFHVYFNYFKDHYKVQPEFAKLTDLNAYKIGIIRGTPITPYLKKAGLKVRPIRANDMLIKMLEKKRIDLWPSTYISARFMVDKYFPEKTENFTMIKKPVYTGKIALVYMKEDKKTEKIIKEFQKGFNILKKSGKYKETIQKYWPFETPKNVFVEDMR